MDKLALLLRSDATRDLARIETRSFKTTCKGFLVQSMGEVGQRMFNCRKDNNSLREYAIIDIGQQVKFFLPSRYMEHVSFAPKDFHTQSIGDNTKFYLVDGKWYGNIDCVHGRKSCFSQPQEESQRAVKDSTKKNTPPKSKKAQDEEIQDLVDQIDPLRTKITQKKDKKQQLYLSIAFLEFQY